MDDVKDLITQAQAARIRGVTPQAISGIISRQGLTVVEIAGQKFLKRSDVENYKPQPAGRPAGQATAKAATKPLTKAKGKKKQ